MREGRDNSSFFTVFSWVHCVFSAREKKIGAVQEQPKHSGIYIAKYAKYIGMNFQHVSLKKILKKTTVGCKDCEKEGRDSLGILLCHLGTLFY